MQWTYTEFKTLKLKKNQGSIDLDNLKVGKL